AVRSPTSLPYSSRGQFPGRVRKGLGRVRQVLVGGDEAFELAGQAIERLRLELAHPLARESELLADRLERGRLALEAEAQLEELPLSLRQAADRTPHRLAPQRLTGRLGRIVGAGVGEQVAELAAVVVADALVQRDRR